MLGLEAQSLTKFLHKLAAFFLRYGKQAGGKFHVQCLEFCCCTASSSPSADCTSSRRIFLIRFSPRVKNPNVEIGPSEGVQNLRASMSDRAPSFTFEPGGSCTRNCCSKKELK